MTSHNSGYGPRGLVVKPNATHGNASGARSIVEVDPQLLRFYTLFWDMLALGYSHETYALSDDLAYLDNAGIIKRSYPALSTNREDMIANLEHKYKVNKEHGRYIQSDDPMEGLRRMAEGSFRASTLVTFRELSQQQPNLWSMAGGPHDTPLPKEELMRGRGIVFELFNCIPVPNRDVPLADVLEFRNRRIDELVALRVHLEEVYQTIRNSADSELAIRTQMDKLQLALKDVRQISKESKFGFQDAGIKVELNPGKTLSDTIKGAANGGLIGAIAAVVASILEGAKVETGYGLKDAPKTDTPFQYVMSYNKELFA